MTRTSSRARGVTLLLSVLIGAALLATACGRKTPGSRLFVIGLDGATFDLLEPWLDAGELPHLKALITGGVYGELRSVYPILSPVAWTSMATGVNPGKHGIFDFEYPDPGTPGKQLLYTAEQRRALPVWKLLSEAGKSVAVLNVPMTYPPDDVNGVMVSGFPYPDRPNLEYTHPRDLQSSLGNYPLDKMGEGLVKGAEAVKLSEIVESRDAVARVLGDWMKTRTDDMTWAVFTATDRIQHFFWGMMDPKHPYHTEELGREFGNSIHEFWMAMDKRLGDIVAALPADATIMIVSDHGFAPIYREVNTMNWFQSSPLNEYARTHPVPDLYITNGIFRYRLGTTHPMGPEYDKFIEMFQKEAASLVDPATGGHPIERVVKRSDLYSGRQLAKAPDLVMIESPNCYIGAGDPAQPLEPVTDLHSTSYSAYHRPNGIFVIKGPNVRTGQLQGASLLDVTPTILHLQGLPVPADMDGRVLSAVFTPEWLKKNPPRYSDGARILLDAPERQLSPEEKKELQAVPYIR
jgi:predicted AlkP superfamily phosphohydrolase/phosphomutase